MASKGVAIVKGTRNMEKLDKDLQNWLWFFASAAVVVSAGLAKIKLGELAERR